MAEPHVLTGLVNKYRETAGKLKACEAEAVRLQTDLQTLHAAIQIFKPDFDSGIVIPIGMSKS